MTVELAMPIRMLLFVVIFTCASVLIRGAWSLSSVNLAICFAVLCAATWAHRQLTVHFPGEKEVPTFRRQVEVFLMVWVPVAVLLALMKLVDLGVIKSPFI